MNVICIPPDFCTVYKIWINKSIIIMYFYSASIQLPAQERFYE